MNNVPSRNANEQVVSGNLSRQTVLSSCLWLQHIEARTTMGKHETVVVFLYCITSTTPGSSSRLQTTTPNNSKQWFPIFHHTNKIHSPESWKSSLWEKWTKWHIYIKTKYCTISLNNSKMHGPLISSSTLYSTSWTGKPQPQEGRQSVIDETKACSISFSFTHRAHK